MAASKNGVRRRTQKTSTKARSVARADARVITNRVAGEMAGVVTSVGRAASAPLSNIPSTDLVSELNNIDFGKMIGGPLQAAVEAQVASSLATVDFINAVGFTGSGSSRALVMVDFSHSRDVINVTTGVVTPTAVHVNVPLLAMLCIPSLRIEHVIVDFNVKLTSVESSSVSTDLKVAAALKAAYGPVELKVTASYQRKTATSVEVKKEYTLNVNVKAVQDEIPAGLEKILNILSA